MCCLKYMFGFLWKWNIFLEPQLIKQHNRCIENVDYDHIYNTYFIGYWALFFAFAHKQVGAEAVERGWTDFFKTNILFVDWNNIMLSLLSTWHESNFFRINALIKIHILIRLHSTDVLIFEMLLASTSLVTIFYVDESGSF